MVVGVLRLTLSIPGATSLKDKRQVIRRLIERARARYNVSIAEVGENDVWQRAQLGAVVVSNDHSFVNQVLDKITRDVENAELAQLIDRELEIETYSEMHRNIADKPLLDELTGGDEDWDAEAEERALRALDEGDEKKSGAPDQAAAGGWLKEEDLK
jgi:uncharacterized protein